MKPQEQIDAVARKANPTQKIVVGIIVPIVIVLLGYGIMAAIDDNSYELWDFAPDDLEESWWGWMLVFIAIGLFEWLWFKTRRNVVVTTSNSDATSFVSGKESPSAEPKVMGGYVADGKGGGTAVLGKDATPATVIQTFLMHVSDKLPEQHKAEFCQWAQLPTTPWSGNHRSLFSLACIAVLQEAYRNGEPLSPEYEAMKESFVEMDISLPRPLTGALRRNIRGVLLGPGR